MKQAPTRLILVLLLTIAFIPLASAEVLHPEMVDYNKTVAFSDLGLVGSQEIQVWVGSTLVMTGNTTAGSMPQPIGDYHVVTKPSTASRWTSSPVLFFNDMIGLILANFAPIFLILCMIAIASALAGYGRGRW